MSRLSFIYLLLCFTRRSGWQYYCPFGLLGIIYYFNPWSLTTGRETSSLLQYHSYHPTHHSIRDLPNREGVHDFAKPGGGEVTTSQTMWSHSSPRSSFFSRLNYIWGQFSFLKMHALNSHLRSLTWGDSCLMSSPVVWAMERKSFLKSKAFTGKHYKFYLHPANQGWGRDLRSSWSECCFLEGSCICH